MEKRQLKTYQGIVVFILSILVLLFIAAPIQANFGMMGVLITEGFIFMLGLIPAIILKADLREVFPVKRPKLRQIAGVVIQWLGSLLIVTLVSLFLGYLFPESYNAVSNALQDVFTSIPMLFAFLIIAVSPAICEEVLVRGFIQSAMYRLKNRGLIIVVMGIIFGIFHLDPIRFLPTAILGMVLTYIMMETRNILLPALFHFINNGFSTLVSFLVPIPESGSTAAMQVPLISIGVYLIMGAVAPFLLLLGARLLHDKLQPQDEETAQRFRKQRWTRIFVATGISAIMLLSGFAITMFSLVDGFKPAFEVDLTEQVSQDTENFNINMQIDQTGDYTMKLETEYERGMLMMEIVDENDKVVYETSLGQVMTLDGLKLPLEKGRYDIKLHFLMTEEDFAEAGQGFDETMKENLNLKGDLSEMTPFHLKIKLVKPMFQY